MPEMAQDEWWEQNYEPGWPDKSRPEPWWWQGAIRSAGKSEYCGLDGNKDARVLGSFHGDHLVPKAKGRSDDPLNIVVACAVCNRTKRTYDPSHGAGPPRTQEDRERLIKDAYEYILRRANQGRLWKSQTSTVCGNLLFLQRQELTRIPQKGVVTTAEH